MTGSCNTILISGGATGIGLALADAFLKSGNEVIICGRRREKLRSAKARLPRLHVRVCDVSKSRSRLALVEWVTGRFKSLNVLVNNAGIQRSFDFTRGPKDMAHAEAEIATNLAAPIHLSALLIPHLRRQRQSAIVNVSSGLALTPIAAIPVYCATKAAIHSLSLSMRHQLRNTRIRVFEIAPPMVDTALGGRRRGKDEIELCMSAAEVSQGILDAFRRDRYEVALGAAVHLRRQRDAMFASMNQ
ncbi:MAG: hypothetical protein AMJ46_06290 [Latescibacteria bacterium DG_63]|nr:MAG: hypothetical protein AMJ46_06290 [Latescibacteria bacterium DG_63]